MFKKLLLPVIFTFIISLHYPGSAQDYYTFYDQYLEAESSENYMLPYSKKDSTKNSMRDLPRNSFFLGGALSMNYSYMIPANRI